MTISPSEELARLAARVTQIEAMLTHFERTLDQLHEVALDQSRRLDALHDTVKRALGEINALAATRTEPPKPEDEIPPHY